MARLPVLRQRSNDDKVPSSALRVLSILVQGARDRAPRSRRLPFAGAYQSGLDIVRGSLIVSLCPFEKEWKVYAQKLVDFPPHPVSERGGRSILSIIFGPYEISMHANPVLPSMNDLTMFDVSASFVERAAASFFNQTFPVQTVSDPAIRHAIDIVKEAALAKGETLIEAAP